jgi:hypothetical protein
VAREGKVQLGKARRCYAREGLEVQARQGRASQDMVRQGKASQGKANKGKAMQGKSRHG